MTVDLPANLPKFRMTATSSAVVVYSDEWILRVCMSLFSAH